MASRLTTAFDAIQAHGDLALAKQLHLEGLLSMGEIIAQCYEATTATPQIRASVVAQLNDVPQANGQAASELEDLLDYGLSPVPEDARNLPEFLSLAAAAKFADIPEAELRSQAATGKTRVAILGPRWRFHRKDIICLRTRTTKG